MIAAKIKSNRTSIFFKTFFVLIAIIITPYRAESSFTEKHSLEKKALIGVFFTESNSFGEQIDAFSGLSYNRARWYDMGVGRFVSVDPFGGDPMAPVSLHRYLYGNQSPVSFYDPTGRMSYTNMLGGQSSFMQAYSVISRVALSAGRHWIAKAVGATAIVLIGKEVTNAIGDAIFDELMQQGIYLSLAHTAMREWNKVKENIDVQSLKYGLFIEIQPPSGSFIPSTPWVSVIPKIWKRMYNSSQGSGRVFQIAVYGKKTKNPKLFLFRADRDEYWGNVGIHCHLYPTNDKIHRNCANLDEIYLK